MKEQMSFSDLESASKRKRTRKEIFLMQMEQIVPVKACCEVILPYYIEKGTGRQPIALEKMFRMYLIQNWYNTSDPATEDLLYDIAAVRDFVGIDLLKESVPDETTLCRFRHLLEKNNITQRIFNLINEALKASGKICSEGTIVDATLISAPSSTHNKDNSRDKEMSSTHKNGKWHFGLKLSIGADKDSGIVHSIAVATAKTADIEMAAAVLTGKEEEIYGDAGYCGLEKREDIKTLFGEAEVLRKKVKRGRQPKAKTVAVNVKILINGRRMKISKMPDSEEKRQIKAAEKAKSQIRAKVEYPFRIIKRNFGFEKTPYKGLKKATAKIYMLMALANLYLAYYIKPKKPKNWSSLSIPGNCG
jgi:IS5 family transposase